MNRCRISAHLLHAQRSIVKALIEQLFEARANGIKLLREDSPALIRVTLDLTESLGVVLNLGCDRCDQGRSLRRSDLPPRANDQIAHPFELFIKTLERFVIPREQVVFCRHAGLQHGNLKLPGQDSFPG